MRRHTHVQIDQQLNLGRLPRPIVLLTGDRVWVMGSPSDRLMTDRVIRVTDLLTDGVDRQSQACVLSVQVEDCIFLTTHEARDLEHKIYSSLDRVLRGHGMTILEEHTEDSDDEDRS